MSVKGAAPTGRLKVLTIQHTDYRTDMGEFRWWLRRNTLGGFNARLVRPGPPLPMCAKDTPPARPYIRPAPGQTLDDLERQSE